MVKEKREKNWKDIYQRKNKLPRAKQLGFVYPVSKDAKEIKKMHQLTEAINLLFVCSRNQWRSPTAEKIYKNKPMINVRSAGTSPSARRSLSSADIQWADIIFVMETKHQSKILADFPGESKHKKIIVMGIEDNYQYMDEELIEEITYCVDAVIYEEKKIKP
jgi:predicted protein tyrosine phosphatase